MSVWGVAYGGDQLTDRLHLDLGTSLGPHVQSVFQHLSAIRFQFGRRLSQLFHQTGYLCNNIQAPYKNQRIGQNSRILFVFQRKV